MQKWKQKLIKPMVAESVLLIISQFPVPAMFWSWKSESELGANGGVVDSSFLSPSHGLCLFYMERSAQRDNKR